MSVALRCVACDAPLQHFSHSKTLPDGSQDDMCSRCKAEIERSESVRYKDYVWETESNYVHDHID